MHPPLPAETLLLTGPDAAAFAHAQFSSKVDLLDVGQWQFSAWLDARGRVRALFHLARLDQQRYLLLFRGGGAAAIADALSRFIFRSRLELTALPRRGLTTGAAQSMYTVNEHDDVISLGCDTHSLDIATTPPFDAAWRLMQIREGWPWLPPSSLDAMLPAALSLQRLHAVVVDKGCYPGQEIVARLHFRGGHKRHLHRGRLSQPVAAGETLRMDGQEVGSVLDVVTDGDHLEALLVLNDEVALTADSNPACTFDGQSMITLQAAWPA